MIETLQAEHPEFSPDDLSIFTLALRHRSLLLSGDGPLIGQIPPGCRLKIYAHIQHTVSFMRAVKKIVRIPGGKELPSRNPVQLSDLAKAQLDHVKQAADVQTYNEAISFLYRSWRKEVPSAAGKFPGIGPFEREEDDPHRVPH